MTYSSSHSFDTALAAKYGVPQAILINHFQFWISHNKRLDRNFYDGRTWMYQTIEEIAAHFGYFNTDQVRRIVEKLVELGVLKKGNYNKTKFDRTVWYAFENEEIFTVRQICQMDSAKEPNQFRESAETIPDTKQDTKKTTNEPVSVVVPFHAEKMELLKPHNFDASFIKFALDFTVDQIKQAIECLYYANQPSDINAFATQALKLGWKPNIPKTVAEKKKEEEQDVLQNKIDREKKIAISKEILTLANLWKDKLKNGLSFEILGGIVYAVRVKDDKITKMAIECNADGLRYINILIESNK